MKQNKIFQSSVKIWVNQFIYMLIAIVIALILLIMCVNMLNIETLEYYDKYVQMCIVGFGFLGMIYGTHKIFGQIRDNKMYLSRKTKYLVLLYQAIMFAGFGALCLAYKLSVVYFTGAYLSIFLQFLLNYYYTKYNNYKFSRNIKKVRKKDNKPSQEELKTRNEGMIDIEKLR